MNACKLIIRDNVRLDLALGMCADEEGNITCKHFIKRNNKDTYEVEYHILTETSGWFSIPEHWVVQVEEG
jgi:hypothetical protein